MRLRIVCVKAVNRASLSFFFAPSLARVLSSIPVGPAAALHGGILQAEGASPIMRPGEGFLIRRGRAMEKLQSASILFFPTPQLEHRARGGDGDGDEGGGV